MSVVPYGWGNALRFNHNNFGIIYSDWFAVSSPNSVVKQFM